ncbi:MAG: hypothetical protein NXI23_19900 [Bacteroidetes bacterium]|nr:hypothetical protein [Bacteroidota bacterium]
MQKIMLSCEEVTLLMEKKLEEKHSLKERIALFFHTMMCDACKQYEKQTRLLDSFLKANKKAVSEQELDFDSKKLEEKILQQLNKNPDKHDDH